MVEQNGARNWADMGSAEGTGEGAKEKILTFVEVQTVLSYCFIFYFSFQKYELFQVLGLKKYCVGIKSQNGVV